MKVFISHSSKDQDLAARVVSSLEKSGLDVWYDKREILPGDNWADKIAQGLKESDAMAVLLTPSALESDSVNWDIDFALTQKPFKRRLIPVIVGDPENFPRHRIPGILHHLRTVTASSHGTSDEELNRIADLLKEAA